MSINSARREHPHHTGERRGTETRAEGQKEVDEFRKALTTWEGHSTRGTGY